MPRRLVPISIAACLFAGATPAWAQALTSKTANIESPQTTPVGQLHFPFTHRFALSGGSVSNSPTFALVTGLTPSTSAGLRWASGSRLIEQKDAQNAFHNLIPPNNEFELSVKQAFLAQSDGPLDLTGILAYNTSANSGDAAMVLARSVGPVTLLGTLEGFTNGFGAGSYTAAGGAGIQWHVTRFLQLSADVNGVLYAINDRVIFNTSNTPAVSLAVGFEIPYSPHTVLLYVTNADTMSLQGASRGAPPSLRRNPALAGDKIGQILDQLRFGFEFNVPFTGLARWLAIFNPPPEPPPAESAAPEPPVEPMPVAEMPPMPAAVAPPSAEPAPAAAPEPTARPAQLPEQVVTIAGFAFKPDTLTVPPGTVVRWVNKDTVFHTATSDKPGWDSGNINAGASWSRKFDEPGTYPYHCTPHPFMVGKVVVQ